jgi:hypothetical protein
LSIVRTYFSFIVRTSLLAVLTAIAVLVSTYVVTQWGLPSWIPPAVSFITLFLGSLYLFVRQKNQTTVDLLKELKTFGNVFYGLALSNSTENRQNQMTFILDRVDLSKLPVGNQKEVYESRISRIRSCHETTDKWFECYKGKVECLLKNPKIVDADNTKELVIDFEKIVSYYHREVINAPIDIFTEIKFVPDKDATYFNTKLEAFKTKYNYFVNGFNDYVKRLNDKLDCHIDLIEIISLTPNIHKV